MSATQGCSVLSPSVLHILEKGEVSSVIFFFFIKNVNNFFVKEKFKELGQ